MDNLWNSYSFNIKGKELGEPMLEFPVEMSLLHSVLKPVKEDSSVQAVNSVCRV